ncbi:MAG TPA: porin, partial [Gammaproteobacteria bacterium]|nr:porin [Gammaproteobacteria bacterium]
MTRPHTAVRSSLWLSCLGLTALGFASPAPAQNLENRVRNLERELKQVKRDTKSEERALAKWQVTGYADAGFTATTEDASNDAFTVGSFNPTFHFQYSDFLLFESELEVELEDDGATNVNLEYSQLNLIASDHLTVVLGKFLSPIGQFQERLHPSWVNKLPTAPAGYGHGGAQPLSEAG